MRVIATLLLLACPAMLMSQTKSRVRKSTDFLFSTPVVAGITTALIKKDYTGLKQLAFSTGTAIATNYALELSVRKARPDHTGQHSFPSTHTLIAFTGAEYVQRRYGWKWGLPAFIISSYVAWGRINSGKHDWWDVAAGAANRSWCKLCLYKASKECRYNDSSVLQRCGHHSNLLIIKILSSFIS